MLSPTHVQSYICHASMNLDNVDVLYLQNRNVYRPDLKNKTAT